MDYVTYRWVDGPTASDADWDRIESILATRGWMSLSRTVSRILVAETPDGEIAGFQVLQLIPHTEPLYVRPSARGTGLAEDLTNKMYEYLIDVQARGWLAVAESKFAEDLCEKYGMQKLAYPVYVKLPTGGG